MCATIKGLRQLVTHDRKINYSSISHQVNFLSLLKDCKICFSPANLRMGSGSSGVKTDVITVTDFLDGESHEIICFLFGQKTLEHLLQLASGDIDYLERLPDKLKV